jgi:protein-L-isoaspartate(D-aspartate) O-methyltransferase
MRREDFIPDTIWVRDGDGFYLVPLDRADDPGRWRRLVESGDAIATQVDDGTDRYDGKGIFPTSSSSALWLMEKMLDLLDVQKGMNVLEIGAGTGYNAALLAERAVPGHVTTMEVDPAIAEHARQALLKTGYPVTVITGDGALGYAENAPYDRVVATASVVTVPYPWVRQTRPGGRVLLPLDGPFRYGALACLIVHVDGAAHGRFHGEAGFMPLRGQRPKTVSWRRTHDDAQVSATRMYPHEPFTEFEAAFAVGTKLPGCVPGRTLADGVASIRLAHSDSGSWASLTPAEEGHDEYELRQYGPRRLWDELEAAYRWWTDAGRPDHTRFGMTVTPEGQTLWLDTPDQVVSPR